MRYREMFILGLKNFNLGYIDLGSKLNIVLLGSKM